MTQVQHGTPHSPFHAVRFHRSSVELCALVCDYVIAGIASGQPALVIATADHQAAIVNRLAVAVDITPLQLGGLLTLWDAGETLARLETDRGRIDQSVFEAVVPPMLEQLSGRAEQPVRVYGEMVDVLWQRHLKASALQLEGLWNDLARVHDFSLLCGYSASSFSFDRNAAAHVCGCHTHVLTEQWHEKLIQPVQQFRILGSEHGHRAR
jgi:MEDS: MEthanogen/methylotroph, DcmR Sensory domain